MPTSKIISGIGIKTMHKRNESKRLKKEKKKNKKTKREKRDKPNRTETGHKVNCTAWGC